LTNLSDIAMLFWAITKEEDIARKLIAEYVDSLDFSLDFQNIDKELEYLSRFYAPPFGMIILTKVDDEFVGVACMRDLGNSVAEISRMYVKPNYRGKGLGRKILDKLVYEAKSMHMRFLRLDTVPDMESALHLFVSKGFYEIEDYGPIPLDGIRFMELKL